MDELGLTPSSTGEPSGDRVGYRMSHYIVDGGAFARAFDAMPRAYLLPWTCWEPQGGNNGRPSRGRRSSSTPARRAQPTRGVSLGFSSAAGIVTRRWCASDDGADHDTLQAA